MPRRLKKRSVRAPRNGPSNSGGRKERMTFHLPLDIINRAKNAVYWTPGLTLADLAARSLARALDELERKRGAPFLRRKAELKGGRPVKL
jgi:hypothetical protein